MGAGAERFLETYFDEVTPAEFYREVWPVGELERKGEYITGKYCGIAVEVTGGKKPDGRPKICRYSITDDLEILDQLIARGNFCLCSPISYAGKARTAENARLMYALAVDVDRLEGRDDNPSGMLSLWTVWINDLEEVPKPTYIVSSGTGVHLYYLMERPVELYEETAKQLQRFKRRLTEKIWRYGVVNIDCKKEIQQEGIYQGFRIVGTITKTGGRARAFLTGDKWTIDALNAYVEPAHRVTAHKERRATVPIEEAAQKWPDWYQRRVVDGEPRAVWHVSRRVYDWWKRKILDEAYAGHRYYCVMILAIYARKCSFYDPKHNPEPVTREELERDAWELLEPLNRRTVSKDNPFTEADILDALEAYNDRWIRYTRATIEYRSGIIIPANKRNYQTQAEHLEEARAIAAIRRRRRKEKGLPAAIGSGRPDKRQEVEAWQQAHPGARMIDCARDTGMSRPTIAKYWRR